jgi:hypothetical protein
MNQTLTVRRSIECVCVDHVTIVPVLSNRVSQTITVRRSIECVCV